MNWVQCSDGVTRWGRFGAAGILFKSGDRYYLQFRGSGVDEGDTWGIPGGALEASESPLSGASREVEEELGFLPPFSVQFAHEYTPCDDWSYTTFVAEVDQEFYSESEDWEHGGGDWFTASEMRSLPLHPAFAQSLPDLRLASADLSFVTSPDGEGGFTIRAYSDEPTDWALDYAGFVHVDPPLDYIYGEIEDTVGIGPVMIVMEVGVAPSHQRRGLATELWKRAEVEARSQGYTLIHDSALSDDGKELLRSLPGAQFGISPWEPYDEGRVNDRYQITRVAGGYDQVLDWNMQGWFHSSFHAMPLGTVLVPGGEGGSATNFDHLYQDSESEYSWHPDYVWITDDLRWADAFLSDSVPGFIYRVEPLGFVQQQTDHQYYTTEARIVEVIAQWDWASPERDDGRRDTYDFRYDVLTAKTAGGTWDMSGDVPVWVQPRDELLADALYSWKADPTSIAIWCQNIRQDPYRVPDSGSGKQMKAWAEVILEELGSAPPIPRKLYRGTTERQPDPSLPSGWSELRSVAQTFGTGPVWVLDAGTARGIRIADYISSGRDSEEREWIVMGGDPYLYEPKAASVDNIVLDEIEDRSSSRAISLVAIASGEEVGKIFCQQSVAYDGITGVDPVWYVANIYVDPDWQGLGIATALWEEASRIAALTGLELVHSNDITTDGSVWVYSLPPGQRALPLSQYDPLRELS